MDIGMAISSSTSRPCHVPREEWSRLGKTAKSTYLTSGEGYAGAHPDHEAEPLKA